MKISEYPVITTLSDNDLLLIETASDGAYKSISSSNLATGGSSGGSSSKYIQIICQKSSGTDGGTAVDSVWTNRELNTIVIDETSAVTLSANKFVLPSGVYEINARANFYSTNATRTRLWNNTTNSLILLSSNAYVPGTSRAANNYYDVLLSGKFSISSSQSVSLDYYCSSPQSYTANLGGAEIGAGVSEIYAVIDLRKVG